MRHRCLDTVMETRVHGMQGQGLRDAELVVWLGDFNYRIDTTFEDAKEKARRKMLTQLLELVRLCARCCPSAAALLHVCQRW